MQTQDVFSIGDALKFGWEAFKKNIRLLLTIMAIIAAIHIISGFINKNDSGLGWLVSLIVSLVGLMLQMGCIKISLKIYDGAKTEIADLYNDYPLFLNFLGTVILQGLIVVAGLILLIVPGVMWGIKYYFAQYLVVDKGLTPIEALKKSGEITKGYKWQLFGFFLVIAVINIVAAMFTLGLLLIITAPITMLASTYVYCKLLNRSEASILPATPPPSSPAPVTPVA